MEVNTQPSGSRFRQAHVAATHTIGLPASLNNYTHSSELPHVPVPPPPQPPSTYFPSHLPNARLYLTSRKENRNYAACLENVVSTSFGLKTAHRSQKKPGKINKNGNERRLKESRRREKREKMQVQNLLQIIQEGHRIALHLLVLLHSFTPPPPPPLPLELLVLSWTGW